MSFSSVCIIPNYLPTQPYVYVYVYDTFTAPARYVTDNIYVTKIYTDYE